MIRPLPIAAAMLALLPGCTADPHAYPSLAPRAIERLGFAEPAAVAPAAAVADPALDAQIAALGGRLDHVAAGFAADLARAQAAASRARGKPVGGDTWLDAQAALAGLDDWRAQASAIVTEIDEAASARAAALAPDYPALAPLRARAQVETDREAAAIARLQGSIAAA